MFNENLKDLRMKKNLLQKEVAKACKISPAYYSLIEKGERKPSLETAKKIAFCLGITLDKFYRAMLSTIRGGRI